VGFGLVDNGHVPVALELFEVMANQNSEFVNGTVGPIDILAKALKNLLGLVIEKLNQNVVFVFEIEINRTVGDTGFFSNLRNGRLKIPLAGEYLDRGL
jgi:hypothetical protein